MQSDVDLDAETEDDFFGVKGEPKFDGSEPPFSQPNPALVLEEALGEHMVGYEGRGLDTQIRLNNVFFQILNARKSAGRTLPRA